MDLALLLSLSNDVAFCDRISCDLLGAGWDEQLSRRCAPHSRVRDNCSSSILLSRLGPAESGRGGGGDSQNAQVSEMTFAKDDGRQGG